MLLPVFCSVKSPVQKTSSSLKSSPATDEPPEMMPLDDGGENTPKKRSDEGDRRGCNLVRRGCLGSCGVGVYGRLRLRGGGWGWGLSLGFVRNDVAYGRRVGYCDYTMPEMYEADFDYDDVEFRAVDFCLQTCVTNLFVNQYKARTCWQWVPYMLGDDHFLALLDVRFDPIADAFSLQVAGLRKVNVNTLRKEESPWLFTLFTGLVYSLVLKL
ncbi:hypothetical protein Tco_0884845 [Tanacetum coccineum]